jgi:hypothetical protein
MTGKTQGSKGPRDTHRNGHLDQTDTTRYQGQPQTPARGARSNPGNQEAGVGHTRGHDRPGRNTGGRGRDAL